MIFHRCAWFDPLDSPLAHIPDIPQSVRAISHGSASHRSMRPDRSGSCSGHGAASFVFFGPGRQQSGHSSRIWSGCDAACWKWCGGGETGQAAISRQLMPMETNASMPMHSARARWLRDMAGSCWLLGIRSESTRLNSSH